MMLHISTIAAVVLALVGATTATTATPAAPQQFENNVLYCVSLSDTKVPTIAKEFTDGAVACARFVNHVERDGWNTITVESYATAEPRDQAWAAGFIEGALTQQQTHFAYLNAGSLGSTTSADVQTWAMKQQGEMERTVGE
jgi:hypothetical protein